MGALIRKLVAVVAAAAARLHPRASSAVISSVASDAGYLILIPLARRRSRASGGTRSPGIAAVLRRRRRGLRRQRSSAPDRRMITEITNEALGVATGADAARRSSPTSSSAIASLDRPARSSSRVLTERIIEPRLGQVGPGGAAGRRRRDDRRRRRRAAAASRGPALRRWSRSSVAFVVVAAAHPPAGRPAAQPGDRRDLRQDAVHGQPAVHHLDALPGRGHRLRHRAPARSRAATTSSTRHEDLRRPRRPDLHAAVISQFIAYFNYSNMPSVLAIALADWLETRRHRRPAAADRVDPGDRRPRHHHPGRRSRSGRSSPRSSSRCSSTSGVAPQTVPRGLPRRRLAGQRRSRR